MLYNNKEIFITTIDFSCCVTDFCPNKCSFGYINEHRYSDIIFIFIYFIYVIFLCQNLLHLCYRLFFWLCFLLFVMWLQIKLNCLIRFCFLWYDFCWCHWVLCHDLNFYHLFHLIQIFFFMFFYLFCFLNQHIICIRLK